MKPFSSKPSPFIAVNYQSEIFYWAGQSLIQSRANSKSDPFISSHNRRMITTMHEYHHRISSWVDLAIAIQFESELKICAANPWRTTHFILPRPWKWKHQSSRVIILHFSFGFKFVSVISVHWTPSITVNQEQQSIRLMEWIITWNCCWEFQENLQARSKFVPNGNRRCQSDVIFFLFFFLSQFNLT